MQLTKVAIAHIFIKQACDSIIWGHFYIGFNDFKSNNKILIDFTGPFSSNDFKENDEKKCYNDFNCCNIL